MSLFHLEKQFSTQKIFVWKQKGEFRHLGAMLYELNNE